MAEKTRVEMYDFIIDVTRELDIEGKYIDEISEFCNAQKTLILNKNERVKAKAAAKKAEGDELRAIVKSVLTSEFQTGVEIREQIDYEGATPAKITARLTQLVKLGEVEKKADKKIMTYRLV